MTKKVLLLSLFFLVRKKKKNLSTRTITTKKVRSHAFLVPMKKCRKSTKMLMQLSRALGMTLSGIENTYVFTISKADLERVNGLYTLSQDSILVPCKKIPAGFEVIGKKVKISGQLMSCGKLLSCPFCRYLYGRKFILTKIK